MASRSTFCLAVIATLLAACHPDLAEIETRQQALRREVDVLAEDVATMRGKMQEMGIVPKGPVATLRGPSRSIDLGVTVAHTGRPPPLRGLGPVQRREGTPCGYRLRAVPIAEISDKHLLETGSGAASPLAITYDGRALAPHAGPGRFEQGCGGAFRHQSRFVFLSPFSAHDTDGDWSVGLVEDQPVRRGDDGLGVYWVYPGTSTTFSFARPWSTEDGEFAVHLDARLLRVGRAPRGQAHVEVLGERALGTGDRLAAPAVGPPGGPWAVTVASPEDGPFVLVESLWVGNDEVGHVVSPVSGAS